MKESYGGNDEEKMTEIYLAKDHLLLEAGYGNPQMHSHWASHVLVSLYGDIRVVTDKESVTCRGAVLPSGTAHTVDSFGYPILVFLFDITSVVSEKIEHFSTLERQIAERIALSYQQLKAGNLPKDYEKFFTEVMGLIEINKVGSRITDERISHAVRFVEERLQDAVTAKDTAKAVYLSESRFSHLFKEQTGIAFSGYLVFRRLYYAYVQISEGMSITEASLTAGFSSPSHFATVNKKMFGITASDLSGEYSLHKIVF